jgi:branched-chain amino acid transport system substrate-binding protein
MVADLVGRRLGKYEIQAEIGRGGMGTVYLAHDPLLQRRVAVKVLAPYLVGQPVLIERFLREARAAARLKHPNIVTIYDVGQEGSTYYFVMEYVEGPSLATALAQRDPMSPGEIVKLLRPLASALDYAHGQGLVHRDVKPGNILLAPGGEPALGDFGIARAAEDARLTTTGTLVGTPEYMSPEQARGEAVDRRSDLYSLAIVAYELLGGATPFAGSTPHGVLYRQVHEAPPPLRRARLEGQAWPPAVDAVLRKALAKDPGERYETAGTFVEALAQGLAEVVPRPVATPAPPEPVTWGEEPTVRWPDIPAGDEVTALVPGGDEVTALVPGGDEVTALVPGGDEVTALVPGGDEVTALVPGAVPGSPRPQELPRGSPAASRHERQTPAVQAEVAPRPFPPPQPAAGTPAPAARRPRWRRTWSWLGLALLLFLGARVLALVLLKGGGEPGPQAGPSGPTPVTTATQAAVLPTATPRAVPPTDTEAELFVCNDPAGCVDLAAGQPIHLGTLLVVAGPDAALGTDSRRGVELAVAERREIRGHPLRLSGQDSGCNAEAGFRAANELARDPSLVAVVGPSCSSEAREAIPILCRAGIPLVSPSNTAPELTGPERPNEYWCYLRTAHNDVVQGQAAARFAREVLGLSRAATIHDGSPYARQLQEIFAHEFQALGGTITGSQEVAPREPDVGPALLSLAPTEPQVLYYPVFLELGAALTREARGVDGLRQVVLLGSDGLFSPDFLQAAGEAARGFLWTSPDLSAFGPGYSDLAARYREQYGEMPIGPYHAHAYDAANLILAAIERVAVEGPGGSLHIPRRALTEALFATRDFPGITGRLTCSPTGDCADPKIAVYEAVDVDPGRWDPGEGEGHNPVKIWP